ncbi:F-box protein CPR1-like isoform X2 [Cucumis melo]|uniref:F-box protein CPR1-like isoform X2 n=1 Tax=Cucumis melo TaxID=3656 RepID=A0ABM3KQQ5_CUCME|nr:F-box protein CPR1-like isoform X2 [Cucumis melo]XP_008442752.2 F-box protein CPR1-like isoform X2 [Cucumis melo]XP_050940119.1 F-box protein CPR1-like isoform X2 [Cucumis melo]
MVVSDVVIQILSKLPPESLLRFKSVCKSWYALIDDPKFLTKHMLDSFPHKHVLIKRALTNDSGEQELVFSILKFSLYRSVSIMDINLPFQEIDPYLEVCGHSHGLVCLSNLDDVFLVNPMTRQFRKLPPSILISRVDPDVYSAIAFSIGFGYDAKSSNFKVVRIVSCRGNFVANFGQMTRVEIYDLSKGKWREIEAPLFCDRAFRTPTFDMYHEGIFYFWGYGESRLSTADHIITFDMSQEVCGKISVPESYDDKKHKTSLGILNRSIVLFVYPFESNEKNIDIWEMKKDESSVVSWSKLLTIDPTLGIEHPLLFVSSEELLMESREGHVIMYNTKTQESKKLPIEGEALYGRTHRFQAINLFIKSLVSVEGGRDMINYDI